MQSRRLGPPCRSVPLFGRDRRFGGCWGRERWRDRWFRGGQWSPIQLFFCFAYAMLGPLVSGGPVVSEGAVHSSCTQCLAPVSEVAVVLEALMRTRTKCPCSRPGAGACAVLRALLLRALGSPSRQKSLSWRVHCPLWHKFCRNQAAIELSPTQHARVSYHTE